MSNWLMLRGFLDKNNKKSLKEDSDMWIQLFNELVPKEDYGVVWYVGVHVNHPAYTKYDYIFARGGHPEYEPILKKCKNAHITYYGAGARIVPEKDLGYNLILCDTEEQVEKCKEKYPHIKASTWIKPAAKHFKPIECEKEYDVCFVANCHSKFQEKIKRVKWVYKTVPSYLKLLHLGKSSLKPPSNVTVKQVSRLNMPKWYSKCKFGIIPYKSYDSAPRVISEMMACGVKIVVAKEVNFWRQKYIETINVHGSILNKEEIWEFITYYHKANNENTKKWENDVVDYYENNLSIKPAAEHLRKLIHG